MSEFGAVVIIAYHPMIAPVLIYDRFNTYGISVGKAGINNIYPRGALSSLCSSGCWQQKGAHYSGGRMMLRTERLEQTARRFLAAEISPRGGARATITSCSAVQGQARHSCSSLSAASPHLTAEGYSLTGEEITDKRVQERGIGLVFQDLALFPHYSVKDNIMYPLKIMKLSTEGEG
ncbi:MAG: hypothetical protein MZV63_39040 [Marinilabiliales bacterium]|nr:hypothetical protein [Marinilabiliales bacterium]